MGFTIQTYQLFGLPSLPNIYVSIHGSYAVKKLLDSYIITFTTYFQASPEDPVITQKDMSFSIQALPSPAVLYLIIYDYIKGQLDPYYGTEREAPVEQQQLLVFQDDQ
jgi:hypothetical protein